MLENENYKLNKKIKENITEKSADPWQDFFLNRRNEKNVFKKYGKSS